MNATDVIGYIVEGAYYCPACSPTNTERHPDSSPIFASSETDSWSHCCLCEELIPENLTSAGVEQAQIALEKFLVQRQGRPEIVLQWATALNEYAGAHDRMSVVCDLVKQACEPGALNAVRRAVGQKYRNALLLIQGQAGAALKEET